MRQLSIFGEGARLQMNESIRLTVESLHVYGPRFRHWAVAWSGGKDSTALVTMVVQLIERSEVPCPETLTVLYADTRLELLPLYVAAAEIRSELANKGIEVRVVMADVAKRFLPYVLGRGVPPPNNNTLRWCTRQIKVDPMIAELRRIFGQRGEQVLMLTGVRQGESAIRDGRIAMSCGRNGGECGQGWYQEAMPGQLCATLAPLLHWRVCHVWEWLRHWAPIPEWGDWSTELIAEAYGGDEAEEANARTGCTGCPLTEKDTALDMLLRRPEWTYLAPLKLLRPLWRELRKPRERLRKPGGETRADGTLVKNQQRMGPLKLETRRMALARVLEIQNQVNAAAAVLRRPTIDLLNAEEVTYIEACLALGQWPDGWSGEEPSADEPMDSILPDGSVQPLLWRN